MANNAKLTVQDMKDMLELFIKYKLYGLKIGDFEIQKTHYDPEPIDNKASLSEDVLFYSGASQFPPEVQEELFRMMKQGK